MHGLVFVFAVICPTLAWAVCPPGSFESFDNYGNKICKNINGGGMNSIQGSTENCPAGTHPWIDTYGNKVCQSFDNKQQFYDTAKGCPIGTIPAFDVHGKPICQKILLCLLQSGPSTILVWTLKEETNGQGTRA